MTRDGATNLACQPCKRNIGRSQEEIRPRAEGFVSNRRHQSIAPSQLNSRLFIMGPQFPMQLSPSVTKPSVRRLRWIFLSWLGTALSSSYRGRVLP